jgi:ectoine hydroxylase-related dioxygenase (phytanoyl-CoA dioxygenase family)
MSDLPTASIVYSRPENLLKDFASRGLVVLAPESLGVPADIHRRIFDREREVFGAKQSVNASVVPEVLDVLRSPGLVSAMDQLLGENWAIVPYTHNAPFVSGSNDQHWHKDDNGPFNGRKQRHHPAVQVEMLYYPQAVAEDMGPTATVPYSQYWTFNHEENHDNFAGADHLDFNYQISGMEREPVSGPNSNYPVDDIVSRNTAHDIRMRDAVTGTGWPLARTFEAAPLRAGSVVIYSHNLLHRGNHRRDDWQQWQATPRFMWRFWLYRTTETNVDEPDNEDWTGTDELTGADLDTVSEDVTAVWRYHYRWLHNSTSPCQDAAPGLDARQQTEHLYQQLHEKGDVAEPRRIGAAYRLAAIGEASLVLPLLENALYCDRESVRRAATYGLIAMGAQSTGVLLKASHSALKWVRKAGVFGLGESGALSDGALSDRALSDGALSDRALSDTALSDRDLNKNEVVTAVSARLLHDPSVYVRSVAAGSLGCIGRRAVSTVPALIPVCVDLLLQSLAVEENRLGMDRAQKRSIKFVRPTDDSDVCEGIGINYGLARFQPVRSAVRENAMWSMVILCSHGAAILGDMLQPTVEALTDIVHTDDNIFCVGFALDALSRLSTGDTREQGERRDHVLALMRELPLISWEPLSRTGFTSARARAFQHDNPSQQSITTIHQKNETG